MNETPSRKASVPIDTTGRYGSPEAGWFLHGENRFSKEPTQYGTLESLSHKQYEVMFDAYDHIARAFGIENLAQHESEIRVFELVQFIPRDIPEPNESELVEYVDGLVSSKKMSGYVGTKFRRGLREMFRRRKWIQELLIEAKSMCKDPSDEEELSTACYTLIAGEKPNRDDVRIIITPLTVHVVNREQVDQTKIQTSQKRTTYKDGVPLKIRPLDDATERAWYEQYNAGYASIGVYRPGGEGVVTTGFVSSYIPIATKEVVKNMFETMRHEFDHVVFELFEFALNQEEITPALKTGQRIHELYKLMQTCEGAERKKKLAEIMRAMCFVFFYKKELTQREASEFLSQYGDGGVDTAVHTLKEKYVSTHLGNHPWYPYKKYVEKYFALLKKKYPESTKNVDFNDIEFDYGGAVKTIREAGIDRGAAAVRLLESAGFSRYEVAKRLRFVPFSKWIAFARRYVRMHKSDRKNIPQ
jgi:hypothetical protein